MLTTSPGPFPQPAQRILARGAPAGHRFASSSSAVTFVPSEGGRPIDTVSGAFDTEMLRPSPQLDAFNAYLGE